MNGLLKRTGMLLLCLVMLMSLALPAAAADSNVIYNGKADNFVFLPGSSKSGSDLFPNFKDVMPGDSLTQEITVKNKASNRVRVKIYIRALGAEEDAEFLNQMKLTVAQNGDSILFKAPADETAQLTNWTCLGTFYSGAEIKLNVTLDVPITMGNEFQNSTGKLQWEFRVEEFAVEASDPSAPKTGDDMNLPLMYTIMGVSLVGIIVLLILAKKNRRDKDKK